MIAYDSHIHSWDGAFDAKAVLAGLDRAGFTKGVVFSEAPMHSLNTHGNPGILRLKMLLDSCAGHLDRLIPVLWVHPDEPDVYPLLGEAVEKGIVAFKIICNNFYAYEDKSMRLLEAIARLKKPVMFHSGILWDETESSKYNRPLNWEALCTIPDLHFSLAHCSWPWYDECLALYGKFLTNLTRHPELNNEMYFDMTPGTPVPYRKDLYTKLLTCGYDVEHNLIWGTDSNTAAYNDRWTSKWYQIDNAIMDELGTLQETREQIFYKNTDRFLGLSDEIYHHRPLTNDG